MVLSLDHPKTMGFCNVLNLKHLWPPRFRLPATLEPTRTRHKPNVFQHFATWPSLWTLCSLYQIPTHTSGCLQMPPDTFRYLQIPSDASRYLQIPPNICRCSHMPPDISPPRNDPPAGEMKWCVLAIRSGVTGGQEGGDFASSGWLRIKELTPAPRLTK